MPGRQTYEVVPVNSNSAVGQKSCILSPGLDYIAALIVGSTAVASNISNVEELINTEPIRNFTGTNQENINLTDLISSMSVDNILRINWEQSRMKSAKQQYALTRNTMSKDPDTGLSIDNFSIRWTDNVTDTYRVLVEADTSSKGGPGGIERFSTQQVNVAASATFTASLAQFLVTSWGMPERRWFRRMHMLASTGTLANGDVVVQRGVGNTKILQRTAASNVRQLTDAGVRAVPTSYATASGGMILDQTETAMAELFDGMMTLTKAQLAANPNAGVAMYGKRVMPYPNLDVRISPSAATALNYIFSTVGRL